mmetsp:Transcript_33629/g.88762  ORF Transcript_33629/g.88762 Transcript_33629/m.88762 type:complete len:336 (-) Transcript_33629:128-1135(-)
MGSSASHPGSTFEGFNEGIDEQLEGTPLDTFSVCTILHSKVKMVGLDEHIKTGLKNKFSEVGPDIIASAKEFIKDNPWKAKILAGTAGTVGIIGVFAYLGVELAKGTGATQEMQKMKALLMDTIQQFKIKETVGEAIVMSERLYTRVPHLLTKDEQVKELRGIDETLDKLQGVLMQTVLSASAKDWTRAHLSAFLVWRFTVCTQIFAAEALHEKGVLSERGVTETRQRRLTDLNSLIPKYMHLRRANLRMVAPNQWRWVDVYDDCDVNTPASFGRLCYEFCDQLTGKEWRQPEGPEVKQLPVTQLAVAYINWLESRAWTLSIAIGATLGAVPLPG